MPASITFVAGRAGSGKSRMLRCRIRALCEAGAAPALIVPEQFTFEAERELAETLSGGLVGVEVYSFTSLAQRVLEAAGERAVFLSAQGRRMVIRRAVEECRQDLRAFGGVCDRPGFCKSMDGLFSLCKRAELTPERLSEAAQTLEADPLGRKLGDMALLFGKSEAALAGAYLRDTDALCALRERIPDSFLRGRDILVDNCDIWAEQIYGVLDALMGAANTLTLCVRADLSETCRDKPVFANEYKAYARLRAMAAERGCPVEVLTLPQADAPWGGVRYASPALAHLEAEAFAYPFHPYTGTEALTALRVHAATDIGAEAEAAADAVLYAARAGMRYRDMAVVACDLPAYVMAVQRVFRRRGIPYFTDAKHPLGRYALPRLLSAALRCVCRSFPGADMIALCKSGLAGVGRDEAEAFENHVLARGVRGGAFHKPFANGVSAAAEAARAALMPPLETLGADLRAADTAAGKTEALYAYMDALGVREAEEARCERLREAGRLGPMEENRQVYEMVMELFSQLHAIMGESRLSTARFLALFEEGVAAYEVGVTPATADQVLLGSIDRTRARGVRALFLLGAVEGALPQSVRDDGVIDDAELARMAQLGLSGWDDTEFHAAAKRMDAYLALTKPKELLYISYRTAGEEAPAALVERILALFPRAMDCPPPQDAPGGFTALMEALRTYAAGGPAPDADLCAWYAGDPRYQARLQSTMAALFQTAQPGISEAAAARLFGDFGSASRLESFNACPFRHYARYGLGAQPRREYRERRADEGAFCHEALAAFTAAWMRRGKEAALSREGVEQMLDGILPPLLASHNGGVLLSSGRMRALGRRLAQRVQATAWAVAQQLAASSFLPVGSEVAFGRNAALPPLTLALSNGRTCYVSGKIDRLDGFTAPDGARYYRVLDYKSGETAFDFAEVYHGLRMQLPLYVAAASAADAVAGMYYQPIDDPAVEAEDAAAASDAALEAALRKKFRLCGLTLADARIEEASDATGAGVLPGRGVGRVDAQTLGRVVAYTRQKCARTAERMLAGDIAARPYRRGNRDACGRCDYKSLCRFDLRLPACACRDVGAMDAQGFMAQTQAMDGEKPAGEATP